MEHYNIIKDVIKLSLNQRIKALREERGWTQEELAKKMSVARSNISKYESGHLDMSTENLTKLAEIFNVTLDYLVGTDGDAIKIEIELFDHAKKSGLTKEDIEEALEFAIKMKNKRK